MKTQISQSLVNFAVCGKFHYFRYIPYLDNYVLNRFYCSARPSYINLLPTNTKDKMVNLFLKEYLLHGHLRLFGNRLYDKFVPLYVDYWQERCLNQWSSAPIFHFLLHGNCLKLVKNAKNEGSLIIGEAVNCHPIDLNNRLIQEYSHLGFDCVSKVTPFQQRMHEESSLCDIILTPSLSVTKSYESLGYHPSKLKTINYGADLINFYPSSFPDETSVSDMKDFQLVCVASISPRKGHIYLLEAWRRLNLRNARLLFIGSIDPLMKPILSKYSDLFIHISHVPNHKLQQYLCSSDAFALVSIEDGFGCVVTEAMACGLPVIVSDAVGASDLIHEGETGIIVKSRSVDDIMSAIQFLYDYRLSSKLMGEAARLSVSNFYTWQKYASILSSYYLSLLK
jgi:glycosyltransferase involved in cell wall biosynthesis